MKALRALGVDRAVAYTVLARAVGIVSSTGTVLLIAHRLSAVEQGLYYTLLSLVSLQMVFELGFSFVIQQLAAHECARLDIDAHGQISGDPVAHARLASALQLTLRWYTAAAVLMLAILAPLGAAFFAQHTTASAGLGWRGPWFSAAAASALGLWCMPLYSFLEGCGHVRAVAAMRLRQASVSCLFAWSLLLLHHGLYAPAAVIAGQVCVGLLFVAGHRRFLLALLRHTAADARIHWTREVFPFQWRIAVSWSCAYFTVQIYIPMLFAMRGPVEAGQMGMSLSIAGYMSSLVLPWISTKATPFGRMIAERRFAELDHLFRRSLLQAMGVYMLVAVCAQAGASALPMLAPRLAARMVPPRLFALLVLAAGANCLVQCLATMLRSFKREPFLLQSLLVAALTLILGALTAPRWGNAGTAVSYLGAALGVALPLALVKYAHMRKEYLTPEARTAGMVEA